MLPVRRRSFQILSVALICAWTVGAATAAETFSGPADLALRDRGDGTLMTDRKGMTLYTAQQDVEPGKSFCVGDCAKTWPPALATGEAAAASDWTVITRADNTKQWAYKGKPLYTHAKDHEPGDERGIDNPGWKVVFQPMFIPPGMRLRPSAGQEILVTAKGMTLYAPVISEKGARSNCTGRCTDTWVPVIAPAIAGSKEKWSTVKREDGSKQWAFNGRPLYTYAGDGKPGEMNGQGVDKAWEVATARSAPPKPQWITVQTSFLGPIYADAKGLTLYANFRATDRQKFTCDAECVAASWKPVMAEADAKPVGLWTVVASADGAKQWAYKDRPLYTYVKDGRAGDVRGHTYGFSGGDYPGRTWEALPLSPPQAD